ncbi:DNA mismatch repair protein Msh3 [Tribolium castaneum]|uniref:Zinc-finger domain-containing protein n=2 Tax=Tribolium castaneum TaxID=7070 RepID=D2A276_TRICA|nr:PREDICTED: DNA mismatch repair protein Msh3 [Tribolium castaneum]EFA02148.2 hypothetical protein TcasGA2_TC007800 [Tribolium castaneum]|eukprot:XP_008191669.1 PREDICTED: DNA mismatch repair protein Msh3 [Tribolium castaneum]
MGDPSPSDQLEDGEIVDDDDFEAISDNSIIDSTFGKFASTNQHLRAPPLSSDSESDKIKTKKLLHRKSKHQKRRKKRRIPSSDDSDSDVSPPQDLKGKLKEAIHISGSDEGLKKPLETRLKAMGGLAASAPEPPQKNEDTSDKMDDTELENLRLEALKTAILNKFQRRKRKKEETLENKENDTPKDEKKTEEKNPVIDLEEDEDVLRASLLAGLAKNITEKSVTTKPLPPPLPKPVVTALPKRPINNFKTTKKITVTKPLVKPLIIKVSDSDSDEEIEPKPSAPQAPKKTDLNVISSNVEKFLKEQRAKFESENKKRFKIVNNDKSILEKSAVKLLPKSQQLEYQQLLKRLRNAEKTKKARKINVQKTEPAKVASECVPKASVEVTVTPEKVQVEVKPQTNGERSDSEKRKRIINELTTLQKTLKEIKMQRNGSLQIKSKYQTLTPIIRKITVTSNERKKQEQRIKTLMRDLNEAKTNLSKSHEKFSSLVKELIDKKAQLDKSYDNRKKENGSLDSNKNALPVTSTPIKAADVGDEATISTFVSSSTNNECEDMDVCNSDEADQIDIVDPNDIDQIFKRQTPIKSSVPEYVSPLCFNNYERYSHVDPLGIMCPYEVNGSCRDVDCTYKHYLKNHDI